MRGRCVSALIRDRRPAAPVLAGLVILVAASQAMAFDYRMPPSAREIPESVPPRDEVAPIGRQGLNDFKRVGYGGPCPPPGRAHRYFFKLYAVDQAIPLPPGKTRAEVLDAIQGHVLGQAELMGRFQRR